jgi:hypothetical protein
MMTLPVCPVCTAVKIKVPAPSLVIVAPPKMVLLTVAVVPVAVSMELAFETVIPRLESSSVRVAVVSRVPPFKVS